MAMRVQQSGGSSTSVMEVELESVYMSTALPKQDAAAANDFTIHGPGRPTSIRNGTGDVPKQDGSPLPPPSISAEVVQRWNYPRKNIPRVAACFWTFVVMGANDAAYGVCFHSRIQIEYDRVLTTLMLAPDSICMTVFRVEEVYSPTGHITEN